MKKFNSAISRLSVLFMAFVMIVFIMPAADVLAASKITFKSGKAVPKYVYVGNSYTLKVAGTSVKFYSDKKTVATVGMTSGKLVPKAPGNVKIIAKSKKTGKIVATAKFTVLLRSTEVTVDCDKIDFTKIGESKKLTATLSPNNSTDVVKFYSSDRRVATVGLTGGKVTAVGKGTCVITAYAMATKATKTANKNNKLFRVKVTVNPGMEISAVSRSEIQVKVSLNDLKADDFVISSTRTGARSYVKKVTSATNVNDDITVYNITPYNIFKPDTYKLSISNVSTDDTFTIEASNPVVSKIEIMPTEIDVCTYTPIEAVLYDADGKVIDRVEHGSEYPNLKFTIKTDLHIMNSMLEKNKLYFSNSSAYAIANAEYTNDDGTIIKTGDVKILSTLKLKLEKAEEDSHSVEYAPYIEPENPDDRFVPVDPGPPCELGPA